MVKAEVAEEKIVIGEIKLDAMFSPAKASYKIEG